MEHKDIRLLPDISGKKPREDGEATKLPTLTPSSFKVGVTVQNTISLIFNNLRFESREEAEHYAIDLKARWTAVIETEVTHSFDRPNAHFPVPSDRYVFDRRALEDNI